MATNWTTLSGNDLSRVLSRKIITDADEDTAEGTLPGVTLNPESTTNRSAMLVAKAVAEMRAAVRLAGKSALAVTASSVPPESVDHVLYVAAWRLVSSTPNLNAALLSEGLRLGLKSCYDEASKYFERVRNGDNVTPPSDPTGQDWETAVDEDTDSDTYNPALPGPTRWGDMDGTDDDHATGETADGAYDLPVDMKIWKYWRWSVGGQLRLQSVVNRTIANSGLDLGVLGEGRSSHRLEAARSTGRQGVTPCHTVTDLGLVGGVGSWRVCADPALVLRVAMEEKAARTIKASQGAFAVGHKFWGNQWSKVAAHPEGDPTGEPSGRIKHAVLVIGGKRYKGSSHFQALIQYTGEAGSVDDETLSKVKEGFETQSGHFLDREQAARYAAINQHELHSEDIRLAARDGKLYTQDLVQAVLPEEPAPLPQVGPENAPSAAPSPANDSLEVHRRAQKRAQDRMGEAVAQGLALAQAEALRKTKDKKERERLEEEAAVAWMVFLRQAHEDAYRQAAVSLAAEARGEPAPGDEPTEAEVGQFAGRRADLLGEFTRRTIVEMGQTADDARQEGLSEAEVARRLAAESEAVRQGRGNLVAEEEGHAVYGDAQDRALSRGGFAAKLWVTVGDERTCEVCGTNEAQGQVGTGAKFRSGHHAPPAHVGCRCWLVGGARKSRVVGASEPVMAVHVKTYQRVDPRTGRRETVEEHEDKRTAFTGKVGGIGLKRVGEGKESRWITHDDKEVAEHVKKLGIPPAWQNVRVAPTPEHDLQAIGHDVKGREQRIYSEAFTQRQAELKFSRNKELIAKREAIFKQNDSNLESEDPVTVENAACMKLIQQTGIRPGSDSDTGAERRAYGATTLEGRHVVVEGGEVRLKFVGKKGVDLDITVEDKATADMLVERKKKAGDSGRLFNTDSKALQKYAHTLDGGSFKPKDFRTLKGTMTAMEAIEKEPVPASSMKEFKKRVLAIAKQVADKLGNTPTIALQSYINPFVFERIKPA